MAKMGAGASVSTRLYLEGYHVDNALIQVQATSSVGGPATCQLSMVPTNVAKHIMPGTWVHVFVTDPWDANSAGDLSDYKLFFEGIVVGRGFTRETDGRSFVLQCADPSIFWVNARQFWFNLTQSGGGLVNQLAIQTSGGYGRFAASTDEPVHGYLLSKLSGLSGSPEDRFLDTMIALLDDIGNVNPFYNNARNRFRITDRVMKTSSGNTDQLFQMSLLGEFLNGLAGRKSGQTNLAQLVNLLLAPIYHEWVSVLGPAYHKEGDVFSRDIYGAIRKNDVKKTVEGAEVTLYEYEKATDETLGSIIFKPQIYTLSPPTCNVLFPNMYDHQSYAENFMVEPTRLAMQPHFPIKSLDQVVQGLVLRRPVELEIVAALTARTSRAADAKWGDGAGQSEQYNDFDWTTNEERIRGIAYNFLDLPPAGSALMLTDQGKSVPDGAGGGIVPYLQNVASYEYYKSKYQSRTSSFTGPFNFRPVVGFPMLGLDDSDANMSMVAYLTQMTHIIDVKGSAHTTYGIRYPRLVDEVDWHRPIYEEGDWSPDRPKKIATDEHGQFRFERLFDGKNRPGIPEWFGDAFRLVPGLSATYEKFLGSIPGTNGGEARPVRSVEAFMFDNPEETLERLKAAKYPPSAETLRNVEDVLAQTFSADVGGIDMAEVVTLLNEMYRKADSTGRARQEVSAFTARPFARIDQAFRFSGATPVGADYNKSAEENVRNRQYDMAKEKLDRFEGNAAPGSGYSGTPVKTAQTPGSRLPQMSGAFAQFDTELHADIPGLNAVTNIAATAIAGISAEGADAVQIMANLKTTQAEATQIPRYDGRPVMFDFERRIWKESEVQAGRAALAFTPDELLDTDGDPTLGFMARDIDMPRSEQERIFLGQQREAMGLARSTTGHTPEQRAPTGASLNNGTKLPVPEPMSEAQVIKLRRQVVEAYRDEVRKYRGFIG